MTFEFLERLFKRDVKTPPRSPETAERAVLEVPENWGIGDGSPLVIDLFADLDELFRSPNPPAPFRVTPATWAGLSAAKKRVALAVAYSQHPSANERCKTIALIAHEPSGGVSQALVNRLCDKDPKVRQAASELLWRWHGGDGCRFAALALRDEIRGYTVDAMGEQSRRGLTIGHAVAVEALDFLMASAPSSTQRAALEKIVADEIIIVERVPDVDTRSVKFVGKEVRGEFTYEVYRAKSKQQAYAFLKGKAVTAAGYYIEVETIDGNVGRDIEGVYEI